jgi:hypothetical protein
LFFSLISTGIIILVANLTTEPARVFIANLVYIPVAGSLVVLSILIATRFRTAGTHGKSWILFAIFVAFWFIAEQTWMVYELVYELDPWPSVADYFYLGGYPLLFAFSIFYLYPMRKAITKKLVISTSAISVLLLIPTFYIAYDSSSEANEFEIALAASYPILDAISLCPALIGIALFFRGEVNFLWSLICLATILNVVADTGFLLISIDDSYYTGHPIDMLYLWAYVLFSFGVYSHIKIFKSHKKDEYENINELR